MIIEREISPFCVSIDESVAQALKRMDTNHQGFVFGHDSSGVLEGVMTDGDVRRWMMTQTYVDMQQPVGPLMNQECTVAYENESHLHIHQRFDDRVSFIPLLDDRRRIKAVVRRRSLLEGLKIGDRLIHEDAPVFVIAEVGINHNGSVERARQLIDAARDAGVDAVKFQMRHMQSLYRDAGEQGLTGEDLGAQYTLNLLEKFELPVDDMLRLFDYANEQGLITLCTPWEEESFRVLEAYGMPAYKVASADLTNHPLLQTLASSYKPLLLSTGMSSEAEIRDSVSVLQRAGASYALLHCNSTYPAPFKDVNLAYLPRLQSLGGCPVGYSGHERGVNVAIASVCQGARIVEKHITVDRNLEGSDHKASLLPDEFIDLVSGIRQVEEALGSSQARSISQGEMMNRNNLAKSLVAATPIEAGQTIHEDDVSVRSPGRGLQPNRLHELVGMPAKRAMVTGDFFYESDVAASGTQPRKYSFSRPWGITARWHDFRELIAPSNPEFVEFHLSFKDMDEDYMSFFPEPLDLDLKVHSPDTFNGDHLLDISNPDPSHRERSIQELQRVVDLTRALKPVFTRSSRPVIIASLGGFTVDRFLHEEEVSERYALMADSLKHIDSDGVEIIGQTLPPFPWYFGGQMYLNLFVKPDDTVAFCEENDLRVCFDISHTKLACTHYRLSFSSFVDRIAPHTAHIHMADALGSDGEGLQIGEGEIDFTALCKSLAMLCPHASFMPEIWQGHKNHGEGFWMALERLEAFSL